MAISIIGSSFFNGFSNNQSTFIGDGVATSVTIDLGKAPVSSDSTASLTAFGGNSPVNVSVISSQVIDLSGVVDSSFTVVASIDRTKLTLTFNKALPAGTFPLPANAAGRASVGVVFLYSGD